MISSTYCLLTGSRSFSSVEHGSDLVVEGLVVQVLDLDGLEVLLRVEVALRDEEGLPQHQLLDLGVVVVHDVVVHVALLLLVDLEELGYLFRRELLALAAGRLVVHHLVQLRQGLGVVLV